MKSRKNEQGEEIVQTLSRSSIKTYVNALINHYNLQKSYGENSYPHPRGAKLRALLDDRMRKEAVRKKQEYVDRGSGTLLDSYRPADVETFVRACWTDWAKGQTNNTQSVEGYLRTACDFLLGHNMLLRGENRRTVEFPDLFSLELKNEGPTPCIAMVMIMNNGKMNQFGRLEYGIVVRNRNLLVCPLSQVAFYLFYRWNIVREPPPQFQQRQQWYDSHLIKGETVTRELSYETHVNWVNRIFRSANLSSLKKTHAGRTNGAQQAELSGVSENQIRRAGRWNNDALSSCYLSNFPLEFVRSMAGFPPQNQGNYYLPRAKIQPPSSLLRTVWPWVDEWQAWFDGHVQLTDEKRAPQAPSYEHIHLDPALSAQEDRKDLAGQGFLRLLKELRTILLQDSIILRQKFPYHPLWNDPIFVREDYQAFALEVVRSLQAVEEPEEIRIRQIVPEISNQINLLRQDFTRTLKEEGYRTNRTVESIDRRLEDFFAGRFAITIHAPNITLPQPEARTIRGTTNSPTSPRNPPTSDLSAIPGEPAASAPYDEDPIRPHAPVLDPKRPVFYQMSRTIISVLDLWQEWTQGLGSGPAISALEATYGAAWRPNQKERVFFGRRKVIITEIQRRQGSRPDPMPAVQELELVRQRLKKGLFALSKWIQASQG